MMGFPTMWYVRIAKPRISRRIRGVWSELLPVPLIVYDCQATNWTSFRVTVLKRRLHRPIWVYTRQNAKLLEITCHGSLIKTLLMSMTTGEGPDERARTWRSPIGVFDVRSHDSIASPWCATGGIMQKVNHTRFQRWWHKLFVCIW